MTRAEVVQLLGEPGSRGFLKDREALLYCKSPGLIADAIEYSTVWLDGGKVVAMTTDRRTIKVSGTCDSYPPVDWSKAPP